MRKSLLAHTTGFLFFPLSSIFHHGGIEFSELLRLPATIISHVLGRDEILRLVLQIQIEHAGVLEGHWIA